MYKRQDRYLAVRDAVTTALDKAYRYERTKSEKKPPSSLPVSYTHLRAHETVLDVVCRLLLETKTYTHLRSHEPVLDHT